MINFFSKLLFKLRNTSFFKKVNLGQFFWNKKFKKKLRIGFTLLEMSITILILSIILIGTISFQVFTDEKSKENITIDKIRRIELAIREYSLKNEKLPCPANITLAETSSSYGEELRSDGECWVSDSKFSSNNLIYGSVPTKTLGLTNDYAVDAWNNKISYVISKGYGDNKIHLAGDSQTLRIENVSAAEVANNAVYVLVSGGKNKNGVFRESGTQAENNLGLTDSKNAFSDGFSQIFVKDINTNSFDDIVVFKTKDALVFKEDLETLPCTLKDLRELDSDWDYTSHDSCDINGICKQGTIITSSEDCPDGKISKNPKAVMTSYRPVRKCLKYGQWSDIIFPCIDGCGESNIGSIETGILFEGLDNYININYLKRGKFGEEITLECIGRIGYIKLRCEEGSWKYVDGDCYEKDLVITVCKNNELNSNSKNFIFTGTTGTTAIGGVVSNGSCNTGYMLEGSPIMATCQLDGTWSFSGGSCIAITCQNNQLNSNPNNFTFTDITGVAVLGGVVNGACSTGYVLQGGGTTPTATCQADGTWSFGGGPCVAIVCQNSQLNPNPKNFIFSNTTGTTAVGGVVSNGNCNTGYMLDGSPITATCQADGTWSFGGGSCVSTCDKSILNSNPNNFTFTDITGVAVLGGIVNGVCSTGYTLQSGGTTPTATCQPDGTWLFSGGPCISAVVCQNNQLNSNPNYFTFTGITGTTAIGGIANGACSTGYVLHGSGTTPRATCQSNGTWSFSGGPCVPPGGACSNSIINNNTVHFVFPGLSPTGNTPNGTVIHQGECSSSYNVQYQGDYDLRATCNNGIWNYNGGPCLPSCQNSTLNSNEDHFYFENTTGTTAVGFSQYTSYCETGYNIDGGSWNIMATCQTDGTWSFTGGPCLASCLNSQLANNPNHYAFSYSGDYTGSGVTLWGNCAPGYERISGPWAFNAICSKGVWTFSGGVCGPQ